jgi:hypothetical protein
MTDRNKILFGLVALLEVVGGLMGFWYLGTNAPWEAPSATRHLGARAAIWALFVLLYAATVVAGVLLLLRRPAGRVGSAIIQALQVPSLSVLGVTYTFVVGAGLLAELRWPGPDTYLSWIGGSRFALFVGGKGAPATFGVNALALVLLVMVIPWQDSSARVDRELLDDERAVER